MDSSVEPFVMVVGPSPSEAAHIYDRFFFELEEKTYSTSSIKTIQSRRSHPDLQGRLYYDELLKLALTNKNDENDALDDQMDVSQFYPPRPDEKESIIELIQVIQSSSFDRIKKMALWYYIMLDLDHQAGTGNALLFAKELGLPRSARHAMTGYWLLDRGDYLTAVSYLTDQPDFVSKIINTISPLRYTSISREETRMRALALSQFLTLVDVEAVGFEPDDEFEEARMVATCWSEGIRAAWVQCQGLATSDWKQAKDSLVLLLVGRLLEFCFMPLPRIDAIKVLLALPLQEADEELLSHTIVNPPTGIQLSVYAHAVALDVLLVRKINSGQYYDAILLDRRINSTMGVPHLSREVSSDEEREKLRQLRVKREGLIKNAYSVMTSVERQLLNIGGKDLSVEVEKSSNDRHQDLEMSWEKVGPTADRATPIKVVASASSKPLTPLSASNMIRREKGDESASESFLTAVVQSSPKRNQTTDYSRSGTASPLSRSIIQGGSPSASRNVSLRQALNSPMRNPNRSLQFQKESSFGAPSPLSTSRPYQSQPQARKSMPNEEEAVNTTVITSQIDAEDTTMGPYAKLAEQLETQMIENGGNISVDRILATRSPFRTLQNSTQSSKEGKEDPLSLSRPVRRYKATYEIGEQSQQAKQQEPVTEGEDDLEMEEIPKRRRTRTAKQAKARGDVDKIATVQEQDAETLPGSFPGGEAQNDRQQEGRDMDTTTPNVSPTKRRSTRRNTRRSTTTATAESRIGEQDEVPEMLATPNMTKSKSTAALSRSRSVAKMASTPVRRSARLSVEPESTPYRESESPAKERRSRRAASKGPSFAPASEREETGNEQEDVGIKTRSRRHSKMPGTF